MNRPACSLVLFALVAGCASPPSPRPASGGSLMALYEDRDFFRLRDELRAIETTADSGAEETFLRAVVQHSFNRPAESNATIATLFERGVPDELHSEALRLRMHNLVRLHRYADAADVADRLLSAEETALDEDERLDVENTRRLTRALADVPEQRLVARAVTVLDQVDGRIPVTIAGHDYHIPFDTGANLSLLMRSEADRIGLEIRQAGIDVGTSTDQKVQADLAVADRVRIGGLEFRNVVFLVFPDELLTFPGGHVIEGIVGFPLIEAMGEVRFRQGALEIPERIPVRPLANLALDQLEPLVRVGHAGEALVCRLDTGAGSTELYEPFVRRYPALFESLGDPQAVESGGVGGVRRLPAYTLPAVELELGGVSISLSDVAAHAAPITDEAENDLHCNIGRDAVAQLGDHAINFRSMSLTALPPSSSDR